MMTKAASARRILLVEDHEDSRVLLEIFLRTCGHEVESAADGRQALELADTFHPDIVLTDLCLPGVSGIDLCNRLRESSPARVLRIVALSALVQLEDQASTLVDAFIPKPVDLLALARSIESLSSLTDGDVHTGQSAKQDR